MSILSMALGSALAEKTGLKGLHPLGNRNLSPQAVMHSDKKKGPKQLTPEDWAALMPLPEPTNVRPQGTSAPRTPGYAYRGAGGGGGTPALPAVLGPQTPPPSAMTMPVEAPKFSPAPMGAATGGGSMQPIEQQARQPYGRGAGAPTSTDIGMLLRALAGR